MEPIHKLALQVLGLGLLVAGSFFFHVVAFLVVLAVFIYQLDKLRFVLENTRIPNDTDATEYPVTPIYEQLTLPGTSLGSDGQRSLRENLPESESRWNKGILE